MSGFDVSITSDASGSWVAPSHMKGSGSRYCGEWDPHNREAFGTDCGHSPGIQDSPENEGEDCYSHNFRVHFHVQSIVHKSKCSR